MNGENGTRPARRTKTPDEALAALMRLAARGEKSSGDALRLMHTWGVEQTQRAAVLAKLVEGRFIDDRRYAEAYVREKSRLNGWGVHKIRRMLRTKGIDRTTIDEALARIESCAATEKLRQMLARKMRGTTPETKNEFYKLRNKLIRYGLSLGYDYEDVAAGVEKVMTIY
ncbi:MAG: RecX family transcriptional regulator [Rikenellaceae bacterium]|nr:RecX family transcriptional regulator [Rikenellaceae bacterium]MCL2693223.1 RecX family transcriptional regulator [Rikenellaceae bacterium]